MYSKMQKTDDLKNDFLKCQLETGTILHFIFLLLNVVVVRNEEPKDEDNDSDVYAEDSNDESSNSKQNPVKSWLHNYRQQEEVNPDLREEQSSSPPSKMSSNMPQYIIPLVRLCKYILKRVFSFDFVLSGT